MQSSTAIAFRALVMLILLISVPLVAIFGSDLPAVLRKFVEGKLALRLEESPATPEPAAAPAAEPAATPVANPFAEAAPYRSQPASGNSPSPSPTVSPPVPTGPVEPNSFPGGISAATAGASAPVVPASGVSMTEGHGAPAQAVEPTAGAHQSPAAAANAQPWPQFDPQPLPAAASNANSNQPPAVLPPSDPSQSLPPSGESAHVPNPSPAPAPARDASNRSMVENAASGDHRIRQAEQRLRELGATQYVLETWGPQNKRYRFSCRMAVNGNAAVSRHFELVDDDPWRAMAGVLEQVEKWHAAR